MFLERNFDLETVVKQHIEVHTSNKIKTNLFELAKVEYDTEVKIYVDVNQPQELVWPEIRISKDDCHTIKLFNYNDSFSATAAIFYGIANIQYNSKRILEKTENSYPRESWMINITIWRDAFKLFKKHTNLSVNDLAIRYFFRMMLKENRMVKSNSFIELDNYIAK